MAIEKNKRARLFIRIARDDADAIRKAAEALDCTVSELVRTAALEEASRVLAPDRRVRAA